MKKMIAMMLTLLMLIAGAVGTAEAGLANPWVETTAEGLMESQGVEFGIPEGATNVVYRMMEEPQMAEMDFTWEDLDYTARIAPTDGFEDISGLYYEWIDEMECTVDRCEGVVRRAMDEEMTVDVCLWYDVATGLMYSVSTAAPDLDGFDIQAAADQLFVPMQTE